MIAKFGGLLLSKARPYLPALIASTCLAVLCIREIYDRAGRAALPLDDSFIHLQYARRLAEGHFFSFTDGAGYTSGATSILWPMMLAPFHLVGIRGLSLIWVTWFWGTLLHAAVATETARLARPLSGRTGAIGAGALCIAFGGFAWFGWSGMETLLLPWALARTARLASTWVEDRHQLEDEPSPREHLAASPVTRRALLTMAVIGPLIRPEGAIASALVCLALVIRPGKTKPAAKPSAAAKLASRWPVIIAMVGPLIVPTLHKVFTGQSVSATAQVKWLLQNPYYDAASLPRAISANAELLVTDILNGGDWSTIFVPEGLVYALGVGMVATIYAGVSRKKHFRLVCVIAMVTATFIPCTYYTFLWNRVRYVWPFAAGWFILLACLATEIGALAQRFKPRWTFITPGILGVFVGALAMKLPWSIRDLAQSAYAIDRQQVTLGEWARDNLPPDARIGVNDTGAIAYLSERPTFDIVGLTTPDEARFWVQGAGSRFEHYERLGSKALPTHFIVYPGWMGVPAVLGEQLYQATVTDQTILGGATKVVYKARYDTLGSGALPTLPPDRHQLADELDVSDLESEERHGYVIGHSSSELNRATLTTSNSGNPVADGGRFGRTREAFYLNLAPNQPAILVLRVGAEQETEVSIRVNGTEITVVKLPWSSWHERLIVIPAEHVQSQTEIEITTTDASATFGAYHYWAYQPN